MNDKYMSKARRRLVFAVSEIPSALMLQVLLISLLFLLSLITERVTTIEEVWEWRNSIGSGGLAFNPDDEFRFVFQFNLWYSFLVYIPYFVFLPLRKAFTRKLAVVGAHLLAFAVFALGAMMFFAEMTEALIYCVFTLFYMLSSLNFVLWPPNAADSLSEQKKLKVILPSIICAFVAFAAGFYEGFPFNGLFFAYALICALCILIFLHAQTIVENVEQIDYKLLDSSLAKRTFRFNNKFIAAAVAAVALLGFLAYLPDYSYKGRQIIYGLPASTPKPRTYKKQEFEHSFALYDPKSEEEPTELEYKATKIPPVWARPESVFGYFAVAAGVVFLISLYRLFKRREKKVDGDSAGIIISELKSEKNENPDKSGLRLFLTPNERIRRMFFIKVREHHKRGLELAPSSTSAKLAEDIEKIEDVTVLERYYSVARYSGRELTSGDVKNARDNGKKHG